MFAAIRKRLTWANVAMTLALVFAMTGGAYAAKKYLITSTKQISPSVLKQLKGGRGPAGPAGVAGVAGSAGAKGEKGAPGSNGTDGSDGVSPTGTAFTGNAHGCTAGGVEYKGATTNFVCNGKAGADGPPGLDGSTGATGATGATGSPWTANGTLPADTTVYGHWGASTFAEGGLAEGKIAIAATGVSYPLPLKSQPITVFIKHGESTPEPECTGVASQPGPPEAGHLCIFVEEEEDISYTLGNPDSLVGETGFTIQAFAEKPGQVRVIGQWALTSAG